MSISFGEIIVVLLVCILFFKPSEIKQFLQSAFSFKKNIEDEVASLISEEVDPKKHSIEFFEVKEKCQKQQ